MTFTVATKYNLELSINNEKLDPSRNMIEQINIHENLMSFLPTMDIVIINDGSLIETSPLEDGSQIDLDLSILQTGSEEILRFESFLFTHEITILSEGYRITLHCVMSASDFFESRIESVNGSSLDVFSLMAERSRMTLIADTSIDKQVWMRPGIRGGLWLDQVTNHSWASDKSAFVSVVTRNRQLLRYNLDERASRNPTWVFQPDRETVFDTLESNVVRYKYPEFSSQSGFLNSHYGYGRKLFNFDVDSGQLVENRPRQFIKRTNLMNLNENREVPQRYDSLGFNNSLNVHENYFNAFAQNMRIKSFYSVSVDLMSSYFRNVNLLDRVTLQLFDEGNQSTGKSYAGEYFVDKIATVITPVDVVRRFTLTREGYNSNSGKVSK